jgi:hypothetical protein
VASMPQIEPSALVVEMELEPSAPVLPRMKDKWRAWATASNAIHQALTLRKGRDFNGTVQTMQVAAHEYAHRNGYEYATKIVDQDTIRVEFRKLTAEPK